MRAAIVLTVLIATSVAAAADKGAKPWAVGVAPAARARAEALLASGNEEFERRAYVRAVEQYRAALAEWNHPRIQFNLGVALIQLDRPLEAFAAITASLRYQAQAFPSDAQYQEARNYEKLLAARIGVLVVACAQRGVAISVDGAHALDCPGQLERRVLPGAHAIVGRRRGFEDVTEDVVVLGGARVERTVRLTPLRARLVTTTRWRTWIPWTIAAAGAAAGALGGLGLLAAHADMDEHDARFDTACRDGCRLDAPEHAALRTELDALATSARRKELIGGSAIAIGAATLATGVAMAILNRPITREHKVQLVVHAASIEVFGRW